MADDKKKKEEMNQEDLENVNGGIGIGIKKDDKGILANPIR